MITFGKFENKPFLSLKNIFTNEFLNKHIPIIIVEFLLSLSLIVLPYSLSFFSIGLLFLFITLISKFKWGIYILAFTVPYAADHAGFHIKSKWSIVVADIIPAFPIISLITLLGFALHRVAGLHKWRVKDPVNTLLFLLVCWASITLFWPYDFKHNAFQFFILFNNFLLFYLLLNSVDNKKYYNRLMWCWISFGAAVAIFTFISAMLDGKKIYTIGILKWLTFKLYLLAPPIRAESVANTNETALILNLTICIAIGMVLTVNSLTKKIVLSAIVVFMMFAHILTLSKGGLMGMLAMFYFLLLFVQRFRKNFFRNFVLIHLIIISLLVLQVVITRESKSPRIVSASQAASLQSRVDVLYKPGMKKLLQGNLLKGMGAGTSKAYLDAPNGGCPHAHSIYFSTLFDLGLIGIAIVSLAFFVFLRDFLKMVKFQQTNLQLMFLCCCGGLVATLTHGTIDFEYNTPEIWFFFGLTVATLNLAKQELGHFKPAGVS